MQERGTPLLRLLGELKDTLDHFVKTIAKYQQTEATERKQQIDAESKTIVRLPVEITSYYESEQRDRPVKNRHETIRTRLEYAGVGAAILLAILTLSTLITLNGQLTEMRRQTKQSLESFRLDERAWIEIEPIKETLFYPRTEKIGAAFQYPIYIRNVGKTVARDIQLRGSRQGTENLITMGDSVEALDFEQEKLLLGKVPTAADIPINNPQPKMLAPNTSSAVPVIFNGQEPQIFPNVAMVSYLIGRIDYADAFGIKHWMKFCFFVANPRGELWNCKEGNDEDRNLENPPN